MSVGREDLLVMLIRYCYKSDISCNQTRFARAITSKTYINLELKASTTNIYNFESNKYVYYTYKFNSFWVEVVLQILTNLFRYRIMPSILFMDLKPLPKPRVML